MQCHIKPVSSALETLILALAEACPRKNRTLVLGAEAHPAWSDWMQVTGWQWHKPLADAWDASGLPRVDVPTKDHWETVALLPGKSKEEILHSFALARDCVADGGLVVAALPNSCGAARFEKEFARAAGPIESLSKNKCRAFWAFQDGSWDESLIAEWRALGTPAQVVGTALVTVPGVFSAGRIDAGSLFLIENLPGNLHGMLADLGAGWGYLAGSVLEKFPKVRRIDLYEADSRALACARVNLARHAERATFHWHDVTRGVPGEYDAVIMNPPFHSGQRQDISLGIAFLAASAQSLRAGGNLYLVANRHLPYEATLSRLGMRCRNLAENHTFKVIHGTK